MDDKKIIPFVPNAHVGFHFDASHTIVVQLHHIWIFKWVISASLSSIVSAFAHSNILNYWIDSTILYKLSVWLENTSRLCCMHFHSINTPDWWSWSLCMCDYVHHRCLHANRQFCLGYQRKAAPIQWHFDFITRERNFHRWSSQTQKEVEWSYWISLGGQRVSCNKSSYSFVDSFQINYLDLHIDFSMSTVPLCFYVKFI